LGWAGRYHVLGQSWGGMLAMEHALEHPPGLRSIVVADSPASMPLWVQEANRLRADLPAEAREALARHEAAGTTDSPEYQEAMQVFYRRHVCREPRPGHPGALPARAGARTGAGAGAARVRAHA